MDLKNGEISVFNVKMLAPNFIYGVHIMAIKISAFYFVNKSKLTLMFIGKIQDWK